MSNVIKPSDAAGDFLIPGTDNWENNIYQIATADDVVGGAGDIANLQAWGLANRTAYLKSAVEGLGADIPAGIQLQSYTAITTSGTAPAYTGTADPAITAYAAGQRFRLKIHSASAGAATLNLNSLGTVSIKQYDNSGIKINPVNLPLNSLVDIEYDGAHFVLLNPVSHGGIISSTVMAGSGIAMTSNVESNITSISLSPGTWLIFGNVVFSGSGTLPSLSGLNTSITKVSATPDPISTSRLNYAAGSIVYGQSLPISALMVMEATTTVYLVGALTIAAGTWIGYGTLYAMKVN